MSRRAFDRFMVANDNGRNLKLARLTDGEFRALIQGVLPIASEATPRGSFMVGALPATAEDVSFMAPKVSRRTAKATLEKLRKLGMLEYDDQLGGEWVHDFDKLNPAPKTDPTNAKRQAAWRARNAERNAKSNGGSNGDVTPPEVKKGKELPIGSSSSEAAKATPDTLRLCHLLADLIRQRDPRFKSDPESAGWLRQMRLLIADRDGDLGEIERVLRWSQADEFWQTNILCPEKLRKQFSQLTIKMKAAGLRAVPRPAQPVADVVAEGDRLIREALEARRGAA